MLKSLLVSLLFFAQIPFPGPGRSPVSGGGGGTVTVDALGTKSRVASGAGYTGLTVGSGDLLIATLNFDGVVPTSTSVVWDAVGANQALSMCVNRDQPSGAIGSSQIWVVPAPAAGNKTLSISWTGGGNVFVLGFSVVNADQGTPCTNATTGAAASTVNVTSQTGDMVVGCETSGSALGTSTGTLLYSDAVSGSHVNAMCQYDAGAASVTIGNTGTNNTIAAVSIAHN